jgi:hypothetical protein
MIIERINNNYEEERLYSTGSDELDELLERAFCEGYEYAQKEFARRDYEGLTTEQAEALGRKRSDYAKQLRKNYRDTMRSIDNAAKNDTVKLTSTGEILAGGVKSNYKQTSTRGYDLDAEGFKKFHKKNTTNNLLRTSGEAKKIMRENAIKENPNTKKPAYEIIEKPSTRKASHEIIENPSTKKTTNKATEGFIKKNWNKLGKGGKIAAVALPTAAAVGTGVAIKKHKDKKKKEQE